MSWIGIADHAKKAENSEKNFAEIKWVIVKMAAVKYVAEERRHNSDRNVCLQYGSKIGSAVPILTIANRATAGSRLHHQQQQNKSIWERWRTKSKMKLRPSTFVMSMVMAQTRCTTVRSPSRSLFISDCGDNNSNIVSFNFRLTIAGKILEHAQNARS